MDKSLLCMTILWLLLVIYIKQYNINETFTVNNSLPNHIWMYWENKPGRTKPSYLDLCFKTIYKHNHLDFKIHLLDEVSVNTYLPNLRSDIQKLSIPQKADYIRLSLLYKYGGIWLDSDTIMVKSLYPLLQKLEKHDFVGFGCTGDKCQYTYSGYPNPSNWVLVARKKSKLIKACLDKANHILDTNPEILRYKYHYLGRILIWNQIRKLRNLDEKWDYLHIPSKCVERDTKGNKYVNSRLLSDEEHDPKCQDKTFFVPIYNTAPGFPDWFSKASEEEILQKDILFSKLIKKSLGIK